MLGKVEITFDDLPVARHAVYSVRLDGVVVACVYGPMAAIAIEAVCRYLEEGKDTIKVGDFVKRVQTGETHEGEDRNV